MVLTRLRLRCFTQSKSLRLILFLPVFLYILQSSIKYIAVRPTSYQVTSFLSNQTLVTKFLSNQTLVTKLPSNQMMVTRLSDHQFHRHRLRWWWKGRCIDSPDGENLVVTFCDPDLDQSFSLTADHKLIYDRTGKCVRYHSQTLRSPLFLFDCDALGMGSAEFSEFDIQNGSFLMTRSTGESKPLCITSLSHFENSPCLNDPVGISTCHEVASRIVLMDETFFQNDRKLLKSLVIPPGDEGCDFKACGMNKQTPPIKLQAPENITRCTKPWTCVTVVIKTARRPRLVLRLAQSIRESYNYDLPIVCFDDGPDEHPLEIRQEIAKYPLMNYIVGDKDNHGIAEGRNMALSFVRTRYFLLLDDDMMILKTTNLSVMIDILDTTDTTVVGGEMVDRINNFASLMKFGYFGGTKRKMGLFPSTCEKANRTVPNYPTCLQCDLNTNVFMARTENIRSIGGWDPELKVLEHKDIFIRIKAAEYKLATCRDVKVIHDPPKEGSDELNEEYLAKRKAQYSRLYHLLLNRYNIEEIFFSYKQEVNDRGEVVFFNKSGVDKPCNAVV